MTATESSIATSLQPGIAIRPREANSLHLTEIPRREPRTGEVLIRIHQVGICGTDRELIHGSFGAAPTGESALVLGHEMLGEVAAMGTVADQKSPYGARTLCVRGNSLGGTPCRN